MVQELTLSVPTSPSEALAVASRWISGDDATSSSSSSASSVLGAVLRRGVVAAVGATVVGAVGLGAVCARAYRRTGGDTVGMWGELSQLGWAGRFAYAQMVQAAVPYLRSCRPRVLRVAVDEAVTEFTQRRSIENPFRSIHLAALINVGEAAQGLAILADCRATGRRAIPTRVSAQFLAKARGTVRCTYHGRVPAGADSYDAETVITDKTGTVVARVNITWAISDIPARTDRN